MVTSSQRTALLEKYRCINVEYDNWWDCVECDFIEEMKQVGIEVDKVYFSGFYAQGDGACFVGAMGKSLTYLDHHHQGQFPMIRKLIEVGGDIYVTSTHTGRYYHAHSVTIIAENDHFYQCLDAKSELQQAVIDQWDEALEKEMSDLEEAVTDQWRAYMDDLYRRLEAEYDYLTSDDAVWDTLEANELIEETDDEDMETV